jgi:O-antigen biosynthesis protein
VPPERDLVPYEAVLRIPASRVLVLAPHPDDEVFGCGGAIVSHVRAANAVRVVVMTDGSQNGDPDQRRRESRDAAQVLGYGEPEFWAIADRALRCDEDTVQRVVHAVAASGADLLYAPSPWEVHPDHRQAAAIAAEAARATGVRVAYYELGAPLPPNVLLDITSIGETKQRAMRCFVSQLQTQDYARQMTALNEYRTYSLPRAVTSAEAYLLLSAGELDCALASRLAQQPVSLGSLSSPALPEVDLPLVSILVRSLDRGHLQEALDSIALQTYPRIEVVVIAAQAGHSALARRCGTFPLRLVQTDDPLARSRAANKALAEAAGEYLLFLDDDDWLMPGHVARLVEVLCRQPNCLAAYTGVALVGPDGASTGQAMDLPFDRLRQFAGNLTPIHAVLFSKELVRRGCRFDETLDRLEDWDFWLQVASHTAMVHLPGVSAAYRLHDSSGVHEDAGPQGAATQRIYRKWLDSWNAGEGAALMQRVWAATDLERDLAATRSALEDANRNVARLTDTVARLTDTVARLTDTAARLTQRLAQLTENLACEKQMAQTQTAIAADRERRITELLGSTSWRVTAPLRWLSSVLKPPR